MKAVIFSEHGGPEVLRYTDVPEPAIGARDVLVRVRACALNHLDLWIRRGFPGRNVPLPHIPGSDISGEVAKIGADVTNVRVGDRVLLAPGVSCGQCEQCIAGRDSFCKEYTLFGSHDTRAATRNSCGRRRSTSSRSPAISRSRKPPRSRSFF